MTRVTKTKQKMNEKGTGPKRGRLVDEDSNSEEKEEETKAHKEVPRKDIKQKQKAKGRGQKGGDHRMMIVRVFT